MDLGPGVTEVPGMLAAASRLDISPRESLSLAGNGGHDFGTNRGEPLEANVAAFIIGDSRFVWVSIDTLYVGQFFIDEVKDLVGDLPGWTISFFATHSHNSPALDLRKPRLGEASVAWVSRVSRLVAAGVLQLVNGEFEAGLGSATAFELAGGVSRRVIQAVSLSRRGLQFWKVVSGINLGEKIDARCNVFVVTDSRNGRPIFAVINWPCHPVGEPKGYGYTPSFPRVLRSTLARFLDCPDLPVLFLQGFSAEVRPHAAETNAPRRRGMLAKLFGPGYSNFSETGLKKWRHELATRFSGLLESASWESVSFGPVYRRETELDLAQIFTGATRSRYTTVLLLRLSPKLVIVALSGEIPSSCSLRVRTILGNETIAITAGCYGDTVGYLPNARFCKEKGYEGFGFTAAFGLPRLAKGSGEYLDLLIEESALELKMSGL